MIKLEEKLKKSLETLKSYSKYYSKNNYNADDLLNDTVVKILENKDKIKDDINFIGWCVTIMKNIYLNKIKYEKIRRTEDLDYSSEDINISTTWNDFEEDNNYEFLKNNLSNKLFDCFKLFYEGYDYESISNKLNIPIGTVKSRINSARKILKEKI